jgi:cyclin B
MKGATQFHEGQLRPCAKELCLLLEKSDTTSLQAVKKKFSCPKFLEVAKIRVERQAK